MEINFDDLPKVEFNWRPKCPKPPSRIEPSAKSKQFTARRRMVELQRDLNRIEREFAL